MRGDATGQVQDRGHPQGREEDEAESSQYF